MTRRRQLQLEWAERQGRHCLKVSGWTEPELGELGTLDAGDLGRRLAVFPSEVVAGGGRPTVPAVAGRFNVERDAVCFVPRFPFVDGMRYSLLVDAGGDGVPEVWEVLRPEAASTPTAEVVAIYPTAATLPVNLLRVYVHFSAPMSEGCAGTAIRVCRDDTGETLDGVFLPPEPELWDRERRRLTMLLDPGRIKRGLVPNLEMGYPLIEGVPIRVIVGAGFRDAAGQRLRAGSERRYEIGPTLRSRLDPAGWRLVSPQAGSKDPVVVVFDRPLDHGLLLHGLRVCDGTGEPLEGAVEPGVAEQSWRFTPYSPWEKGDYRLVIDPRLEDVAGNTPVRVFDRDISQPEDDPPHEAGLSVSFPCGPGAAVAG